MRKIKRLLVTGGAGFMGSSFIRYVLKQVPSLQRLVNLDCLTYAGNPENLNEIKEDPRYRFVLGDIADEALLEKVLKEEEIDAIVHFAAETHVDRSIAGPSAFIKTNVVGTLSLLEVLRKFPHIHFHHISTDEVFGALEDEGKFSEISPYQPNSPYAASKAASDHLVRAYGKTYGLSTTLSHSCNNFGPHQFPEKLIPLLLSRCLQKESLPIYGNGSHVREWLYVDDHAEAIWNILEKGKKQEVYNVGSGCELKNIDLVRLLVQEFAKQRGESPETYLSLIRSVPDRPGHDFRYAVDCTKIYREIGWAARHTFEQGLKKTVAWYLAC